MMISVFVELDYLAFNFPDACKQIGELSIYEILEPGLDSSNLVDDFQEA